MFKDGMYFVVRISSAACSYIWVLIDALARSVLNIIGIAFSI